MMIAMLEKGLRAEEEVQLKVHFRGEVIGTFFVDIVAGSAVLIEIKALPGTGETRGHFSCSTI
jgi:hypothetical protein